MCRFRRHTIITKRYKAHQQNRMFFAPFAFGWQDIEVGAIAMMEDQRALEFIPQDIPRWLDQGAGYS